MVKPRVVETDQGITGEFNTQAYDQRRGHLQDGRHARTSWAR